MDCFSVYGDGEVFLVDDERNVVPFAVKDFRLAVDDAVCRGGIEPAVNPGTDIFSVPFALGYFETGTF